MQTAVLPVATHNNGALQNHSHRSSCMLARAFDGLIPAKKLLMPKRIRRFEEENVVRKVQELKQISDSSRARQFLEEIKRHVDPVLKARGLYVKCLVEICCCEKRNMGTRLNVSGWCRAEGRDSGAAIIAIRLRHPHSHELHSLEHCLSVMWHEIAHITYSSHSADFYKLMEAIQHHFKLIQKKRMVVDQSGFPVEGGHKINVDRHNPSKQDGRLRGLAAAEKRRTRQVGSRVLGGSTIKPNSAQKAAAAAAFRRAQDSTFNLMNTEQSVAGSAGCKITGRLTSGTGNWRTSRPICNLVSLDAQDRRHVEAGDCIDGSNSDPIYCDLTAHTDFEKQELCEGILPSSVAPDTIDLTGDDSDEPRTFKTSSPTQTNGHQATASSSADGWFCSTCIFYNRADALACAGCDGLRSPRDMAKHARNAKPQMRDLTAAQDEAQRLAQQNILQSELHPGMSQPSSTSRDATPAEQDTTHDEDLAFALAREEELTLSGSVFEKDFPADWLRPHSGRATKQGSCRSGTPRVS